jgi:uncharacterized membrane protein (Fun14 family)
MIDASMTNTLIPFAGSGLAGYAMGFALRKIIKWLMIIFGVLAGSFFLGIEMLQKYGYVGEIKWDKLGNDISKSLTQSWAANIDLNNLQVFHHLGIPLGGLATGMLVGFVRTR